MINITTILTVLQIVLSLVGGIGKTPNISPDMRVKVDNLTADAVEITSLVMTDALNNNGVSSTTLSKTTDFATRSVQVARDFIQSQVAIQNNTSLPPNNTVPSAPATGTTEQGTTSAPQKTVVNNPIVMENKIKILNSLTLDGGILSFQFVDQNGKTVMAPNTNPPRTVVLNHVWTNLSKQEFFDAFGNGPEGSSYSFYVPKIDPSLATSSVLYVTFQGKDYQAPITIAQ